MNEYAKRKVKEWWIGLRLRSLYITTREREELTKRGLDTNRCILVDRDKNGTCVFACVRITAHIINGQ